MPKWILTAYEREIVKKFLSGARLTSTERNALYVIRNRARKILENDGEKLRRDIDLLVRIARPRTKQRGGNEN
ncbi:MAG: hypothetical protein ACE5OY_06435 [Candidatus Bathyarchaeia archaeon]